MTTKAEGWRKARAAYLSAYNAKGATTPDPIDAELERYAEERPRHAAAVKTFCQAAGANDSPVPASEPTQRAPQASAPARALPAPAQATPPRPEPQPEQSGWDRLVAHATGDLVTARALWGTDDDEPQPKVAQRPRKQRRQKARQLASQQPSGFEKMVDAAMNFDTDPPPEAA